MPDTRPGIQFDEDGVCLPCRHAQQKNTPTGRPAGKSWKPYAINTEENNPANMTASSLFPAAKTATTRFTY